MSHRPYPDVDRALRQLDRHVPGSLRDPHTYEPQIRPLADWLAEQVAERDATALAGIGSAAAAPSPFGQCRACGAVVASLAYSLRRDGREQTVNQPCGHAHEDAGRQC